MKDFFKQEVQIGDLVVFIEPYYHNLIHGKIVKFTPKGVKIKYTQTARAKMKTETAVGEGGFIKVPEGYKLEV